MRQRHPMPFRSALKPVPQLLAAKKVGEGSL
jgi:hypothetical protein